MREFAGRVAVVTGGASGIGRAMAERFARAGMRLVLADVEESALEQAAGELRAAGATVLPVPTDVSDGASMDALRDATLREFGAVHVLCNNAGVGAGGPIWACTPADWEWTLGVNLWGVVHGLRAFVPHMLESGDEGHIVNTASVAGLLALPNLGPYTASKYAVVGISETLYRDLAAAGAGERIGVSVLCPGLVRTRILQSERNRPDRLGGSGSRGLGGGVAGGATAAGTPPEEIAEQVFAAVHDRRFYILTHPAFAPAIRARLEDTLDGRTPAPNPITVMGTPPVRADG